MAIQFDLNKKMTLDVNNIWVTKDRRSFAYSDGVGAEQYLLNALNSVKDLSVDSNELNQYIRDWTSEYHLSSKRSKLLKNFFFNKDSRVLEVGAGCGAITRYLGENFKEVVSVEGSYSRARIARSRTKNLPNVSIVCSPFQEIAFQEKFDLIFCIGVFEYSESFVSAKDSHDHVLSYFNELLKDNGVLVVAIENQFGLKYFNGANEDHLARPFTGLEGYCSEDKKVRTFGKEELRSKIKKHFNEISFFYPFPDYKVPDCIISEDFLKTGVPAELISRCKSSDYSGKDYALWNEQQALKELSKNKNMDFFSNSFLILASNEALPSEIFPYEAVLYSGDRLKKFSTVTKVNKNANSYTVIKSALFPDSTQTDIKLRLIESSADWIFGESLESIFLTNATKKRTSLSEVFQFGIYWKNYLKSISVKSGEQEYVEGSLIDGIWGNCILNKDGLFLIDQEWAWKEKIPTNVLYVRAIFSFLQKLYQLKTFNKQFRYYSGYKAINSVAKIFEKRLTISDYLNFINLESDFQNRVTGSSLLKVKFRTIWFLINIYSFIRVKQFAFRIKEIKGRIYSKLRL